MSWTDGLLPASFRGAEFRVDNKTFVTGRRNVVHEFAKQDTPYTEDMGRRARRFTITGWVIGDDYFFQRDDLIGAMETEGPGTLVHPTMGEMWVNPDGCSVTETREEGRKAAFELSFIEAGSDAGFSSVTDTGSVLVAAAIGAVSAVSVAINLALSL